MYIRYVLCARRRKGCVFAFAEGSERSDDIMNMFAHEPALA